MLDSVQARPQLHEQTFNGGLAQAIREARPSWHGDNLDIVQEERRGALASGHQRPDILVDDPLSPPVVIEASYDAKDAERDACGRLGHVLQAGGATVRAAVAVWIPPPVGWLRNVRDVTDWLLKGNRIKYALLQGESDNDVQRWPRSGLISGSVRDLVTVLPAVSQSRRFIESVAEDVALHVRNCAECLDARISAHDKERIAGSVRQRGPWRGLTTASVVWLNALLSQQRIRVNRESDIPSVSDCLACDGNPLPSAFVAAWEAALEVNFRSIFVPALAALRSVSIDYPAAVSLGFHRLIGAIERIETARLGSYIDIGAELFPRLSEDRKTAAAFYTRPATAEFLSWLTVRDGVGRGAEINWGHPELGRNIRIADSACGTGTLVRAGYRQIRNLHEGHGGNTRALHGEFMEHGVVAVDISAIAAHLTATSLSAMEPGAAYGDVQIGCVPVGGPDRTGSLEFLENDEVGDLFQSAFESSPGKAMERRVMTASLKSCSLDFFLANPPYSRTRGGQSLFDVAGLPDSERLKTQKRASRLGRNSFANLKAGLSTFFLAKADKKLRVGGRMGFVLPLTAASAASYREARGAIENRYTNIIALTVAGGTPGESSLSSDTGMSEMLLVAQKGKQDQSSPSPVVCVTLDRGLTELGHARESARAVFETIAAHRSAESGEIRVGEQRIGTWVRRRQTGNGDPWSELGTGRDDLALAATRLLGGEIVDMRTARSSAIPIPFVRLGELFSVGPTHHRIGHISGNDPIGAFEMHPLSCASPSVRDLALWRANAKSQRTLVVRPTHRGTDPESPDHNLQEAMRCTAGTLFYARNLRWTSQALVAATTERAVLAGRAWTSLGHPDPRVLKAFALWANSILGALVHWTQGGKQQQGRALVQVGAIGAIPVPNLEQLSLERLDFASREFDRLARLSLLPLCQSHADENRKRIDRAVLRMFDLSKRHAQASVPGRIEPSDRVWTALEDMRNGFCVEPQIHGNNSAAVRLLNERSLISPD